MNVWGFRWTMTSFKKSPRIPVTDLEWAEKMDTTLFAIYASFLSVSGVAMLILWIFVVRQRIRVS